MSNLQTQEQKRAKYALDWIKQQQGKPYETEIKSWSSQFPIMIHTNGFGPACAFFKSRQNVKGAIALYEHLQEWLKKEFSTLVKTDLMDAVTTCNQQQYRLLQAESQAYLQWVKQLAKAYLKGDVTDNGGEQ